MKHNWGKTLLFVYKYLDRVCDGIDNLVEQSALGSFYFNKNRSENDVVCVADRISKLIERKAKLINIKVLVDNCLIKLPKISAQILIEKYIDDDSSENIASRLGLHIRTYFRKLNIAEESFSLLMVKEGFDENKLKKYLSSENWIIEVFEKFENEISNEHNLELV